LKESVRICTASGILVTVAALVIEILTIYFQTDPGANYIAIINILVILGITGAALLQQSGSGNKR